MMMIKIQLKKHSCSSVAKATRDRTEGAQVGEGSKSSGAASVVNQKSIGGLPGDGCDHTESWQWSACGSGLRCAMECCVLRNPSALAVSVHSSLEMQRLRSVKWAVFRVLLGRERLEGMFQREDLNCTFLIETRSGTIAAKANIEKY